MPKKRTLLALVLSLLILIVGSYLAIDDFQFELQLVRRNLIKDAEAIGENLHQVLRQGMSANNHIGVRRTVADTVGRDGVMQVRILGLNGKVYADSHGELVGAFMGKDLPGCVECHGVTPLPNVADLSFWPDRIRVATPVANDSTCMSCHNIAGANSLGVILVDISTFRGRIRAEDILIQRLIGIGIGSLVVGLVVGGWPRFSWRPTCPLIRGMRHLHRARPRLALLFFALVATVGIVTLTGASVAGSLEENDAFCASCHTEPETTYYDRSLAEPVDLASAHAAEEVGCIDCHSGEGVAGRADALTLGAKNVALYLTGQYETPTQAEIVIHTDHCTKCHAEVLDGFQAADHYHYFAPRWAEEEPAACVTCHQAHATEGNAEMGFMPAGVMEPVCRACHAAAVE
jgi:nitrate/TMAO reductase-like tetraheme cytochrome c subunit